MNRLFGPQNPNKYKCHHCGIYVLNKGYLRHLSLKHPGANHREDLVLKNKCLRERRAGFRDSVSSYFNTNRCFVCDSLTQDITDHLKGVHLLDQKKVDDIRSCKYVFDHLSFLNCESCNVVVAEESIEAHRSLPTCNGSVVDQLQAVPIDEDETASQVDLTKKSCNICKKSMSSCNLSRHYRNVHHLTVKQIRMETFKKSCQECKECHREYISMKNHYSRCHPTKCFDPSSYKQTATVKPNQGPVIEAVENFISKDPDMVVKSKKQKATVKKTIVDYLKFLHKNKLKFCNVLSGSTGDAIEVIGAIKHHLSSISKYAPSTRYLLCKRILNFIDFVFKFYRIDKHVTLEGHLKSVLHFFAKETKKYDNARILSKPSYDMQFLRSKVPNRDILGDPSNIESTLKRMGLGTFKGAILYYLTCYNFNRSTDFIHIESSMFNNVKFSHKTGCYFIHLETHKTSDVYGVKPLFFNEYMHDLLVAFSRLQPVRKYLFGDKFGEKCTPQALQKNLNQFCRYIEIDPIRFHDIRVSITNATYDLGEPRDQFLCANYLAHSLSTSKKQYRTKASQATFEQFYMRSFELVECSPPVILPEPGCSEENKRSGFGSQNNEVGEDTTEDEVGLVETPGKVLEGEEGEEKERVAVGEPTREMVAPENSAIRGKPISDKSFPQNFPLTEEMKEMLKVPFRSHFELRKNPPPAGEIKMKLIDAGLQDWFVRQFSGIPPAKVLKRISDYVRQCLRNNIAKKKWS